MVRKCKPADYGVLYGKVEARLLGALSEADRGRFHEVRAEVGKALQVFGDVKTDTATREQAVAAWIACEKEARALVWKAAQQHPEACVTKAFYGLKAAEVEKSVRKYRLVVEFLEMLEPKARVPARFELEMC